MGINTLLQPQQQMSGIASLDQNMGYPMSQAPKSMYANPTQMPTGAVKTFATGGDATTDSSANDPALSNPDIQGLDIDPSTAQNLYALKTSNPSQYGAAVMDLLSKQIVTNYGNNANYDQLAKQYNSLASLNPQDYQTNQLKIYGNELGWQQGQNTSDRDAPVNAAIQSIIPQAKAAGLSDAQINQILSSAQQTGNVTNQQRIASEEAAGGNGIGDLVKVAAPIALSMMLGPEVLAAMPELGALGAGALTGGAVGGISAGLTGGNVGQGVLMGGATGALGGSLNSIDPSIAQGIKSVQAANSLYNATQSGGQNLGADINAFKGISSMAPVNAAQGGLMAGGGISSLGSYSDGGRLLKGPGDGMSDHIPAKIGKHQPARLADGEFVVPADVVSHLGNGSTDAGAKVLYKMLDRIRKARTGNPKQGKQINPNKFIPKG